MLSNLTIGTHNLRIVVINRRVRGVLSLVVKLP